MGGGEPVFFHLTFGETTPSVQVYQRVKEKEGRDHDKMEERLVKGMSKYVRNVVGLKGIGEHWDFKEWASWKVDANDSRLPVLAFVKRFAGDMYVDVCKTETVVQDSGYRRRMEVCGNPGHLFSGPPVKTCKCSSAPDVRKEKDTKPHLPQQSVMQDREEIRQELSRERQASAHLRQLVTQNETTVQQILSDTSQQISRLRQEKDSQIQQLQQQLGVARRENDSQIQQLQQQLADLRRDKDAQVQHHQQHLSTQTQQLQQHLADLRTEKEAQIQQLQQQLADVSREKEAQIQQLQLHLSFQEIEFWRVSAEEVQVDQEILGGGAWGVVSKGKFRGQNVAVKRVYPSILQPTTVDRICREIRTMAQVQHPNLVLFIAAVIDDRTGPMIITEILDTSLRSAYERNRLGSNKLRIFQDVASALNYLHLHREPIIHRDVSSANVLLEAVANNGWKAKLSDFGSANLVQ